MDSDAFEAAQRSREWFHGLTVPPGMWTVIRVDGRAFTKLTGDLFEKPFDMAFSAKMGVAAKALLVELGAVYVYTESDEISVLLAPSFDLFGRSVEKLVSVSAGVASATFSVALGQPAHFDSRLWIGASIRDVVDYFSWRQADAARGALNGWCYWTLRKEGHSARAATRALTGAKAPEKHDLLHTFGINFGDLPAWQKRGTGLWWHTAPHMGHNPITGEDVETTRRHIRIEAELPTGDEYRALIRDRAEEIRDAR